jgi:hypothetical protein
MPLFLITVTNSPAVEKINDIKSIGYLNVSFEPYRSTGAAQCYRCQEFGHSSLTCKLSQKCLKCAGPHRASDCNAEKTDFRCANCGENHTANYKGCRMHPDNRAKNKNISKGRKFIPAPQPATNVWRSIDGVMTKWKTIVNDQNGTREIIHVDFDDTNDETNSQKSAKNLPTKPCLDSINTPTLPESEATNSVDSRNVERRSTKEKSKKVHKDKSKSTKENSNKSKKKCEDSNSSASFFEIIKTVKDIMQDYNIKDLCELLKKISTIMKSKEEDPLQKLLLIFEAISDYFEPVVSDG